MKYTLYDDVPVPVKNERAKYPFSKMLVGQCFFIETAYEAQKARIAAHSYRRRNPQWDYVCRKQEDGGWRLWRTV